MAQSGIRLGHSPCRLCADGPIDSDDMDAAVWCWNAQTVVDCVKCNRGGTAQWWQAQWFVEVVAELKGLHQK